VWRSIILAVTLATTAADRTALPLQPGRTTAVTVTLDVGAPIERAVPSKFYAQAAAADGEQRWADATALYRDAIAEWNAAAKIQPSRALELALAKAERERQRSQLLASRALAGAAAVSRFNRDPIMRRGDALDEGRLLRAKLMTARAVLERVPAGLYARTRDRLRDALAPVAHGPGATATHLPTDAEVYLLLCATYAAAGDIEAGRLARAHVTEAERADAANVVPLAACAAALGETRAAIGELEIVALHPGPGRTDRFQLRDLYLANDWDRLRGDPKFETLFPR
jgi:hypothetical protein